MIRWCRLSGWWSPVSAPVAATLQARLALVNKAAATFRWQMVRTGGCLGCPVRPGDVRNVFVPEERHGSRSASGANAGAPRRLRWGSWWGCSDSLRGAWRGARAARRRSIRVVFWSQRTMVSRSWVRSLKRVVWSLRRHPAQAGQSGACPWRAQHVALGPSERSEACNIIITQREDDVLRIFTTMHVVQVHIVQRPPCHRGE